MLSSSHFEQARVKSGILFAQSFHLIVWQHYKGVDIVSFYSKIHCRLLVDPKTVSYAFSVDRACKIISHDDYKDFDKPFSLAFARFLFHTSAFF